MKSVKNNFIIMIVSAIVFLTFVTVLSYGFIKLFI